MMKYVKRFAMIITMIALMSVLGVRFNFKLNTEAATDYGLPSSHTYQDMPTLNIPDNMYITYQDFRNTIGLTSSHIMAINLATWDKIIRFDTADELFRFSMDVSYNLKYTPFETKLTPQAVERLLSFHYVLGRDIDYSVMKSKRFNPIGYNFTMEGVNYQQTFTGIFDGNGFEITNLYVSGFSELTQVLYEGTELETEISYTEYYSMFAYNNGIIRNLGLINPTFEFSFESATLYKAANIVGRNMVDGLVHHVYVIDYRATSLVSGIRMVSSAGQAAGVLFDNYGTFHDAYFVGRVVINASFGSRFNVQPVLYENHGSGTYEGLAFDDTVYQESVTIAGSTYFITTPNGLAISLTTSQLRNSNATLGNDWFYYPAESNPFPKYPSTFGLTLSTTPVTITLSNKPGDSVTLNSYFVIENALDFIAFSKMLNYTRESNLTPYRNLNYVITGDIDMRMLAANSYQTPSVEFSGTLAGLTTDTYIYGLKIVNGVAQESYHAGMFSVLLGNVYNLSLYESELLLTETETFAGVPLFAGMIAGEMRNGKIRNVLVETTIDLGTKTIGEAHVGGLVGKASGLMRSVYVQGHIYGRANHVLRTDILINPSYYIGGILGSATGDALALLDSYSSIDIQGIGTQSTAINASQTPRLYIGGILGYSFNTVGNEHTFGLLSADGTITVENFNTQLTENQYIGGIIGQSAGSSYILGPSFGKFYNRTTLNAKNRGNNIVYGAGVLTANHTEAVEFIHLFNDSSASLDYFVDNGSTYTGNMDNLSWTTLVNNMGGSLTLSQSKNMMDIELVGNVTYSGLYINSQNSYSLLRFVDNFGHITYKNQTLGQTSKIAGISLSENIDYLNVSYQGSINVFNLIMQTNTTTHKELFVSGFSEFLTMNRYIKNSLVKGTINVSNIQTNTINRTPRNNIFVAGFVIRNNSGNMDPAGTTSMPKATMGILNSINSADITSTHLNHRGITGHGNIFVGGLATFNDGDIQDSANLGDVRFENLSPVDTSNVLFNIEATAGGATTKFRYGVVTGGIAAAAISQKSRIYDSANKGTIIALSRNFTRAGGILGMAIHQELFNGNVDTGYTINNNDTALIQNSILSNSINYGNVSALTISISEYSTAPATFVIMSGGITNNFRHDITQPVTVRNYNNTYYSALGSNSSSIEVSTRESSQERPGINAAAGGVIGYGLSVMRRMMNHGQVSSTDVAGGVVGATVVFATAVVRIDTAINYGTVRAFDRGTQASGYSKFLSVDIMDYESIRDHFYPVNSTFIFPNTVSDIRLYPEDKRGFGGIFGRLQRAANQYMYGYSGSTVTFTFIVNMDPNVDLIGRLDQVHNYYSSLRFFDFRNSIYYSARKNDTTQAVFTGISYFEDNSSSSGSTLYAVRRRLTISIESRKYEYSYNSTTGLWMRTTYSRTLNNRTEVLIRGRRYVRYGNETPTSLNNQEETISRSAKPAHNSTGWSVVAGSTVAVGTLNEYKFAHDLPLYQQVWDVENTRTVLTTLQDEVPNGYFLFGTSLSVPTITEDPLDNQGQYVYGSTFPMITNTTLQQFIYFAENGNLSSTFINSRPNGMYVLATSSGSTFGDILPANLRFEKLLPISSTPGTLPAYDVNYDEPPRINPVSSPSYLDLQTEYQSLFQTQYSDKSQMLSASNQTMTLDEQGGSNTKLLLPTLTQPTPSVSRGIIQFDLNLKSLDFTQSNLNTVTYHINGVQLPKNAVLAKTVENYYGLPYGSDISSYLSSYRELLYDFANPNIPIDQKEDLTPSFSYTFNINSPQTGVITIGYFSIYSEVAQNYTSFMNDNYITDYEVRLNVTYSASAALPTLFSYTVDTRNAIQTTSIQTITVEPVDTRLILTFRDGGRILPIGTNILSLGSTQNDNVVLEYYDPSIDDYVFVDYADYSLTSVLIPNTTAREFSFTLFVNPQLRGGQYRVGYRLLPYQSERTYIVFTKGSSTLRNLTSLEHYSSGTVNPASTTFTSYVNFGYVLDFSSFMPTPIENELAKAYQSNINHYTLPFLDNIKISEFAEFTSITQLATTYNAQGYRIYNIRYIVRSESGTSTTYNHQIIERPIGVVDVFRNNNKVVMSSQTPVLISREAAFTSVSINYGVDSNYSDLIYNLIDDDPTSYFQVSPSNVIGISFSVTDQYLIFNIDQSANSGLYTFAISYIRAGDSPINLGSVYIRKSQGTNAYLIDIQFAELATETNYANIFVSDALGNAILNSTYQPSIYYAGIDYDGANLNGITNFRVDGQVSNIPLDEYVPYFLNYLPSGATISRKRTNGTYTPETSGPDDPNVQYLYADFTAQEGMNENDDVIITYRVRSEDGFSYVYYHITVTDVTYNVSFIFDVVYVGNDLKPHLNGVPIVINVRNMTTNLPVTDTVVSQLPQFSSVINYTNSTNLFHMIGFEQYRFRFGRNKSGYFSFNVRVLDQEGYIYDVTIALNGTDDLQTVSDLDVTSKDYGKYYYINSSTKNRTRNFVITISNARIPSRDYGFTDHDASWK